MMKNLTPEFFLNALIATLLIGIIGFGGFAFYAFDQADHRITAALRTGRELGAAAGAARAADASAQIYAQEAALAMVSRGPEGNVAPERLALIRKHQDAVQQNLDASRQLLAKQGLDVSALEEAGRLHGRLNQQVDQGLKQAGSESAKSGAERWNDVAPAVEALALRRATTLSEESQLLARQAGMLMALLVVVGFVLTINFRNWIRRSNGRSLKAATVMVEKLAAGDLTVKVEGMLESHTRKLAVAFDLMSSNLRTLTSEVAHGARTVADTSAQIAQGNLDLSQRTEEQASTLEETASSMEQLTSTVAQNADNAREASQLAQAASDVARKGGQVVGQVVSTMTDISASSRKIGDIIGVIDGIAFQTNILALNAAVEAARAGEQGRGFAVVAAEVRSLAQRSAAAAKEIKTLIGDSLGKVETGTKQVDAAGKTMGEIVVSVKKVSDLIAEIAAASQEQSAGIGQINTAVAQMEQVVQQNASLVEEASAATESMKEQAASLLHAVSRFRIGDEPATLTRLQPAGSHYASSSSSSSSSPSPITVRQGGALPPAYAAVLPASARKPRAQTGQWEEF